MASKRALVGGPTTSCRATPTQRQGGDVCIHHAPVNGLASAGSSVMRCGLATTLLWIGALKFKDYEVENAEVLVTASPLTSWFRDKLGAQKLGRLIGGAQMTMGSLLAASA